MLQERLLRVTGLRVTCYAREGYVYSVELLLFGGVLLFFVCLFFHLRLAGRPPFGFWGGFSCFVSFISYQRFACLVRAAIFLSLLQAFVVCSFFLCHRHLWSVLSLFATGF